MHKQKLAISCLALAANVAIALAPMPAAAQQGSAAIFCTPCQHFRHFGAPYLARILGLESLRQLRQGGLVNIC
jgi:hypothetical protein